MVKPSNCVNAIRDKLIEAFVDFSAGLVNTGKPFFFDTEDDYVVEEVSVLVSVNYVGAQAVTLSIGKTAGPGGAAVATEFVNAQSLGTGAVSAGAQIPVTITDTPRLLAGTGLTITCAAVGGQTGEGILQVRLRPMDRSRGNASKRPQAAQNPND